jgi:hypothetical protein
LLVSQIVSLVSVSLALVAVCVSTWQARANMQHSRHSRSLPVIAEIFKEFRSKEFRDSVHKLLTLPQDKIASGRFGELSGDSRDDAYEVCYFFDRIGALVAFRIINDDIVIASMGTQIMQVWLALLPLIKKERTHRKTYGKDIPPGFLVFYGHLVDRIYAQGGGKAATRIQRRIGIQLPSGMTGDVEDRAIPPD